LKDLEHEPASNEKKVDISDDKEIKKDNNILSEKKT